MTIQKNIGKNTIGDNNKMTVSLHDYNMSTHDLSTIVRNTQSPGTLVPNLCLVGQKGDTFDIDIDANALTHPTGTFIRIIQTRTPCIYSTSKIVQQLVTQQSYKNRSKHGTGKTASNNSKSTTKI